MISTTLQFMTKSHKMM